MRQRRNRRRLRVETILTDLYFLEMQHPEALRGHSAETLRTMLLGTAGVTHTLTTLAERGHVKKLPNGN